MNNQFNLAISSFNGVPFSSDSVTYISNITLTNTNYNTHVLNNNKLHWPNEITFTEHSIISSSADEFGGLIVAAGFLVPTKTQGGLFYYPFTTADRSQVTPNEPFELSYKSSSDNNWFYHRVRFVDINGDGNTNDILTCRTYKPTFGATKTELVAFILNIKTQTFDENVIMSGACDIFFDIADIDNDGRFEIVAAGFFISQLNIIYSDDAHNSFLNNNAKKIAIDTNAGQLFDVKLADLNLDNSLEILASNHQGNNDHVKGSLYYYKLKGSNIRNATWDRFVIYDNFPVLKQGIKQAAPGGANLFKPNLNNKLEKPSILVAGDGAEYAYLFEPHTSQSGAFNYTLTWTHLFKNTVGGISIADIDGDGYSECAIPSYEENAIYIFTFAP